RNGVQPDRGKGCPQLPSQGFRRGRLCGGSLAAGERAWWERVMWLQDLPHRGLRFQDRFAFRVTAYSRRRREVGLFTRCGADSYGGSPKRRTPVHIAASLAPEESTRASGALTKSGAAAGEEVVLAELDARVAQDRIRGRDVEE